MSKCKAGEPWESYLNGQDDGEFTIDVIGPQGFFTGTHDGDTIRGQCLGNTISYTRYNASGNQSYSGTYRNPDYIRGGHRPLFFTRRKKLTDDDEWVGTHTTLKRSKKKASSGKKASAKSKR